MSLAAVPETVEIIDVDVQVRPLAACRCGAV